MATARSCNPDGRHPQRETCDLRPKKRGYKGLSNCMQTKLLPVHAENPVPPKELWRTRSRVKHSSCIKVIWITAPASGRSSLLPRNRLFIPPVYQRALESVSLAVHDGFERRAGERGPPARARRSHTAELCGDRARSSAGTHTHTHTHRHTHTHTHSQFTHFGVFFSASPHTHK